MTRMISVDARNDMYLAPDGNLAISTGLAAVMQNCAHAVKAQLGEMILQTNQGVPNFQVVWRGAPNLLQFEVYLRRAILEVEGVVEVTALTVEAVANVARYNATIRTVYGLGELNG
jgi:hypothetical protein